MKYIARWVLSALLVLLTLWGLWYFADIVMYILISAVLSFMGHPLVRFFDRMHFRGVRIPHSLSAGLALIVELVVVLAIIGTLVPLVARQASIISGIDANTVAQAFREPLMWLEEVMIEYGLMSSTETLESYVTGRLQEVFVAIDFSQVLDILFSLTGTVFIGLFSVVFITYFFLKEKDLFQNGIMLFTPEKYHKEVDNILTSTRYLLSRYFLGICLEILIMMTMITAFL
ncbi:MAG TPA: AI-2E family transporter, partial [Bacteroidales bacterium]|nr:AI-2E family transporter [Bacteroidales bacterium]